jgi:hypothetical protein
MIDNTHVVVLTGTGKDMIPTPEMAAFAERFGGQFKAHEKGDANRCARVEIPFQHIDNNFLAGRKFDSWEHLNREARIWCDKVNAKYSTKLHASRRELFAAERAALNPLPIHVPEVYRIHQRIVDSEGLVCVHRNRYSVPWTLIGRPMEVRETKDRIVVYDGPRIVASHPRQLDALDQRIVNKEHRPPRGQLKLKSGPCAEEQELIRIAPSISGYVAKLKQHAGGRGMLALRRLLGFVRDYPRDSLLAAVAHADHYKLFDLDRLERLVLKHVAHEYFVVFDSPTPHQLEDDTTSEQHPVDDDAPENDDNSNDDNSKDDDHE